MKRKPHTKPLPTPPAPELDIDTDGPLSRFAEGISREGLTGMREAIRALRDTLRADATNDSAAVRLAGMTHKASQVMGEARKLENDVAKQEITSAEVLEHFRGLSQSAYDALVADVLGLRRKGSVLG